MRLRGMFGLVAAACVASVLLSRAAEGFALATASPAELRNMVKQLMSSKRGKPRRRHRTKLVNTSTSCVTIALL